MNSVVNYNVLYGSHKYVYVVTCKNPRTGGNELVYIPSQLRKEFEEWYNCDGFISVRDFMPSLCERDLHVLTCGYYEPDEELPNISFWQIFRNALSDMKRC